MEITTDASILIAVVGHEPSRGRAIELTTGHSLVAPGSIHWEVGSALSAMVKRERITLAQAAACLDAYLQIPIKLVDVDLKQSMGLVKQFRMYAYDAYVLVCALHLGTPLLSLDVPLKAAARSLGIEVLEV
jgi:predicted nucleic acid-binding protein